MKLPTIGSLFFGCALAQNDHTVYFNAGEDQGKIQCFPENMISNLIGESSITELECNYVNEGSKKKTPCPENISITEDGYIFTVGWKSEHSGTIVTCTNNGNSVSTTLLIIEKPSGSLGIEESVGLNELQVEKDPDSDEPKAFNEVARCFTGYAYPRAQVAWLDKDGNVISHCNSDKFFETSGCNVDMDQTNLEAVDVPLSFKLKDGESQYYTCLVTYKVVENGALVDKKQEYRFPETGMITYGDQVVEVDSDIKSGPSKPEEIKTDEEKSDDIEENEHTEEEGEEGGGELHNALLGTATGIIILVIIIFLIWFIRKKSQNDSSENDGYTAANKAEVSP